jgi:hypothetical protein
MNGISKTNDWKHKLFSEGDLSDYLIDRWQEFALARDAAIVDESKYILHLPKLDLNKVSISNWSEPSPEPSDMAAYVAFLEKRISRLEAILENRQKTSIIVSVPFSGDGNLFRYRPPGCKLQTPQGLVSGMSIQMRFERSSAEDLSWKLHFTHDLTTVFSFLEAVKAPARGLNHKVTETARKQSSKPALKKN